ncbi:uncharacterized protein G6M90_00g110080 [Metarhizium brunneum]|uniref:Uncharacterized protein n=1 Tax=Metarhizium brunneum TaxID=500148 RepID=A0A7D5V4B4_9HYPO|nr:hypothetical protein G6M90_00g110080 [Metarhizium brunneum]
MASSVMSFFKDWSVPYPEAGHGFWGEQTSTLNFCEEDYVLSFYCAELCNLYYHATKDPAFHQAAYAVLTATVLIRSIWVMEVQVRPPLQAEDGARARYILKTMWALVATGEIRGFRKRDV